MIMTARPNPDDIQTTSFGTHLQNLRPVRRNLSFSNGCGKLKLIMQCLYSFLAVFVVDDKCKIELGRSLSYHYDVYPMSRHRAEHFCSDTLNAAHARANDCNDGDIIVYVYLLNHLAQQAE